MLDEKVMMKRYIVKSLTFVQTYLLLGLNAILKRSQAPIEEKTLLLIRLDAIGDYVLFRNFIELLKDSEQYGDHSITLVGNRIWKDLSIHLDSTSIDRFIWVDRRSFFWDLLYRVKKLDEITSVGYETVVQSAFSREFFFDDTIIKLVNAKNKIGRSGDQSNSTDRQKKVGDWYYTKLISEKDGTIFEFYRNRAFFEELLDQRSNIDKTSIALHSQRPGLELPEDYAVLFIGAGMRVRKWSIRKFAEVARHLYDRHGLKIVLCGGAADQAEAKEFTIYFDKTYIDMVGKTSLMELLYIVQKGKMMVANETSAPHLAIALDMPHVFVISNGNHFGRFTPYPKEMTDSYHAIYHPDIEKSIDDEQRLSEKYGEGSELDIDDVSVSNVISVIDSVVKVK